MKIQQNVLSNDLKMFDNYGAYNFTSFIGRANIIWKIQSVESNNKPIGVPEGTSISKPIYNCLDTFTDGNGNYITIERFKIMSYEKKGIIKPYEASIVKLSTEVRKSNRRAV